MLKFLTTIFLSFSLLGCGSGEGIDAIPSSSTSIDQYIGEWTNSSAACNPIPGADLDPNNLSSFYKYHQESINDIYGANLIKYHRFFIDDQCTTWVGEVQEIFALEWFAPTSAQVIANSVRAKAKAIHIQGDVGILPLEAGRELKLLLRRDGNTLTIYESPVAGLEDADGYPIGITPTAIYEKTQ